MKARKKSFKAFVAEFLKINRQTGSKKNSKETSYLRDWKTLHSYLVLNKKTLENKDDEQIIQSINPYWFYAVTYSSNYIDSLVKSQSEIMSEDIYMLYE
jgi:hypothetical protein